MIKRIVTLGAAAALLTSVLAQSADLDEQTRLRIEALNRLKGVDLEANPALRNVLSQVLEKTRGTAHFVNIVRDFNVKGQAEALLDYALRHPAETSGIEAFQVAQADLDRAALDQLLQSEKGVAAVQLVGHSRNQELLLLLREITQSGGYPIGVRQEAVRTLARTKEGAEFILDLAKREVLPAEIRFAAASELNLAPWPEIKQSAAELLPLLSAESSQEIPALRELVKRTGDPLRGREIFRRDSVACSSCHLVEGFGKDVGPALSEIGTKLGKEALYEAILDPNSGISFGFEGWSITMKNGDEYFGIVTSETPDELTVKTQTGVVARLSKFEVASRQKLSTSLMPAGLHFGITTDELVDLVEYLTTLKKPVSAASR